MISFSEACYRAMPFVVRGKLDEEYEPCAREIKLFIAHAFNRTLEQVEKELEFWSEYDASTR